MARGLARRSACALAGLTALVAAEHDAAAGGFEIPDLGSQALGRGAAFVAKADDPTAIYWNPAGLAKQRGTKLTLDANVYLHSFSFRRIGHFADDANNPSTPWGQAEYPAAVNTGGPYTTPFFALATDFGYFDRVTFAAGVFQPSSIANRTFPLGVNNKPSSARYDYVQNRTAFYYPTLAVGIRAAKWLDLGMSAHLVIGRFDQTGTMYADAGTPATCKNLEYFPCDSTTRLVATGTSFAATFGAMIRPSQSVQLGLSLRTPINITAQGVMTPSQPPALDPDSQTVAAGNASIAEQLPLMVKAGGRYIGMDQDFELYDLEVDLTYEAWGSAQAQGPILLVPNMGAFQNIQTIIEHGYSNTFGLRAGGAYNIDTGDQSLFSIRGGAYFDSSATDFATTRVDYDTLTKIAGTLGLSYKYSGFTFDIGYAAVASVPRVVGQGQGKIAPLDALQQGTTKDATGAALAAVNEGAYRGFTHIISLGVTLSIDAFLGKPRPVLYGNPWEPNYAGSDKEGERPIEKKPLEEKPINEQPDDEKKPVETQRPEKKAPPPPPPPEETKKPEKKPPVDTMTPDEEKPSPKKPDKKKPQPPPPEEEEEEEEEPKKPTKKPVVEEEKPAPKPAPPPPPPPEVKPAPPPPPPPPPPPKPPTKRKEWWEEQD